MERKSFIGQYEDQLERVVCKKRNTQIFERNDVICRYMIMIFIRKIKKILLVTSRHCLNE